MKNRKYSYYSVPEVSDMKDLLDFCAEKYKDKKEKLINELKGE